MSAFTFGQTYSRDEIHDRVGGDKQNMMPTVGRRIVCCCITPEKNPKAPATLLIGDHYASARQWADDGHGVPLFIKKAVNHWEYIGQYRVGRATEDPSDLAAETVDYVPKIVLYLERCDPNGSNLADGAGAGVGSNFDPSTIRDARERIKSEIKLRRGQPEFRRKLLEAYGARCAISGCDCEEVLEAAHIYPYRGTETNHTCNGLLLRSDLHTLFDLGLVGIRTPQYTVLVSEGLKNTGYRKFLDKPILLPANRADWPNRGVLDKHRLEAGL